MQSSLRPTWIIGLAARAEVTFFDEPYLGLDAVARQIFYRMASLGFFDEFVEEITAPLK
jgi:hypothetical protein